MSDDSVPESGHEDAERGPDPRPESAWERKRRLAAVFGDVLPDTTSDERDPESPSGGDASEEWLKAQVPPHHGQ